MMTTEEFNQKWKLKGVIIRERGLEIDNEEISSRVTKYLDVIWENETEIGVEFFVRQIKVKFGEFRIYSNHPHSRKWESELNKFLS